MRCVALLAVLVALTLGAGAAAESPSPEPTPLSTSDFRGSLYVSDPTDDLHDLMTDTPLPGFGYMDTVGMAVTLDDDLLTVRFDLADPMPDEPEPEYNGVDYHLNIDTDGDGVDDFSLDLWFWPGDRFTSLSEYSTERDYVSQSVLADGVTVVDGSPTASVSLSDLGGPTRLWLRGEMQASTLDDLPFFPSDFLWSDRVPSDYEWLPLGSPVE